MSDLTGYHLAVSGDPAQPDLNLACSDCGEILCSVEAGDTLAVLCDVATDHRCEDRAERIAMAIGVLAHGRITTAILGRRLSAPRSVVRRWVAMGWLAPGPAPGHYWPTVAGWSLISTEVG